MLRLDITAALVDTAILVKERFGLQYYDALIVAAAQEIGCEKIYSEDMSSGCSYGGVTVENPFEGL